MYREDYLTARPPDFNGNGDQSGQRAKCSDLAALVASLRYLAIDLSTLATRVLQVVEEIDEADESLTAISARVEAARDRELRRECRHGSHR